MAILKVARLGHPVLRKVAAPVPVSEIRSAETQRLIDDMIETMREYNGAGLAAPQVHALKQICVIEVHQNPRYPDAPGIPLTVDRCGSRRATARATRSTWSPRSSSPG
jgi:peptide deformylase